MKNVFISILFITIPFVHGGNDCCQKIGKLFIWFPSLHSITLCVFVMSIRTIFYVFHTYVFLYKNKAFFYNITGYASNSSRQMLFLFCFVLLNVWTSCFSTAMICMIAFITATALVFASSETLYIFL